MVVVVRVVVDRVDLVVVVRVVVVRVVVVRVVVVLVVVVRVVVVRVVVVRVVVVLPRCILLAVGDLSSFKPVFWFRNSSSVRSENSLTLYRAACGFFDETAFSWLIRCTLAEYACALFDLSAPTKTLPLLAKNSSNDG